MLLSYYLGLIFQINGRIRRWEAGRIGVGRGTRGGGTGNGRGKVGRGSSEKAGSGRNGGKLCNSAYNFAIEKGLKQGSQKKRGGSRNARYAGAGGLDHSIETSFPALSHRTISFQHVTI